MLNVEESKWKPETLAMEIRKQDGMELRKREYPGVKRRIRISKTLF
jgi:hypothetical protein